MNSLEVHSTRLFPKDVGAAAYMLTGIAARCDWVVLSDRRAPRAVLVQRVRTAAPRHVFLSLRSPFVALNFFISEVLPTIRTPFVLVSGSEDVTVPHQLDARWPRFDQHQVRAWRALLCDERLVHWFAENLDEKIHDKMSPLPTGMVFQDPYRSHIVAVPAVPPLQNRPLRVLCAHRVRDGAQWEPRRRITSLCRQAFPELCTVVDGELPELDFLRALEEHAFVLCAEGGGLDPSPKAWQSILHGAIPIIRRTPQSAAYAQLPVVFVDEWNTECLSLGKLVSWRRELLPRFDDPAGRKQALHQLTVDHWWSVICSRVPLERG